jgi:hypothetical protein
MRQRDVHAPPVVGDVTGCLSGQLVMFVEQFVDLPI